MKLGRFTGLAFPLRALVGALMLSACSANPAGSVSFTLDATPPPGDVTLSPLVDPRVSSLELRDVTNQDALLVSTPFTPGTPGMPLADLMPLASLSVPVVSHHDLRMVALGATGQEVLGLSLTRAVSIAYGQDQQYTFHMRRPLFFFGGNAELVAPNPFPADLSVFAPGQQIASQILDGTHFQVIDPNSGTPLLTQYNRQLDQSPVVASAATADGLTVLAATQAGNLFVIDTLELAPAFSVPLTGPQVRSIVISPSDGSAILLQYDDQVMTKTLSFIPDLAGLRAQTNKTVTAIPSPAGAPLSAAFAPSGLVDVVFGTPPVLAGQPACASVGTSTLQSFNPQTGMASGAASTQNYTTAVVYTTGGDRLLAQPCNTAASGQRVGQVLVQPRAGSPCHGGAMFALPAPGTAALVALGGSNAAVVAVGRDDVADGLDFANTANGTVQVLEQDACSFSTPSLFSLDAWLLPYRVTTVNGMTQPGGVDIVIAPSDLLVYGIVATPDRTRALILARVTHSTTGQLLDTTDSQGMTQDCDIDWTGYTYHVMLVNLQTGAREQDWMVGVQDQSCSSHAFEVQNGMETGPDLGICFPTCDQGAQGYLYGYQQGFIPAGTSVLFGDR